MISYFHILRAIKLPIIDMTLLSCFALSFQYISKFCHWLLWKHFIQPLYAIFHLLYRHLYTVFTTIHFQWIKNISSANKLCICKDYADGTCMLIFSVYIVSPFHSAIIWFAFSLYCSSATFNMFSKSGYSINGTWNWYWRAWHFSHLPFFEGILILTILLLL